MALQVNFFTSGKFRGFLNKTNGSHVACMSVTLGSTVEESCSKAQKTRQVLQFAMKIFFGWGCGFFVSDITSGGLLGHLGPLHLALGPNC